MDPLSTTQFSLQQRQTSAFGARPFQGFARYAAGPRPAQTATRPQSRPQNGGKPPGETPGLLRKGAGEAVKIGLNISASILGAVIGTLLLGPGPGTLIGSAVAGALISAILSAREQSTNTGKVDWIQTLIEAGIGGALGSLPIGGFLGKALGIRFLQESGEQGVRYTLRQIFTRGLAHGAIDGGVIGAAQTGTTSAYQQQKEQNNVSWGRMLADAIQGGLFGALGGAALGGFIRGALHVTGQPNDPRIEPWQEKQTRNNQGDTYQQAAPATPPERSPQGEAPPVPQDNSSAPPSPGQGDPEATQATKPIPPQGEPSVALPENTGIGTVADLLQSRNLQLPPSAVERFQRLNIRGPLGSGQDQETLAVFELTDGRVFKLFTRHAPIRQEQQPWDLPFHEQVQFTPDESADSSGYLITAKIEEFNSFRVSYPQGFPETYDRELTLRIREFETFMQAMGYKLYDGFQVGLYYDPDLLETRLAVFDNSENSVDKLRGYYGKKYQNFSVKVPDDVAKEVEAKRPVIEKAAQLCNNLEYWREQFTQGNNLENPAEAMARYKAAYQQLIHLLEDENNGKWLRLLVPPTFLNQFNIPE